MATVKKPTAKASAPASKAAPAKKPVAKTVAVSSKKPAPSKSAAKPAPAKAPTGKTAPVKTTTAKAAPVAKSTPKSAPKTTAVTKTAAKAAPKTAAAKAHPVKPAAAKPVAAKKPAVKPPAAKAVPAKPAEKSAGKTASVKPTAAPPATKKSIPEKVTKQNAHAAKPAAKSKKLPAGVLTETDILGMSDDEYMNEAQLAFFKARLQAMKDEILVNARETGEHLKENEVFADPNDRATVEEENMLEQRVRDRERKLLKKIDQSLARIEAGEYGYCLETGEPIGVPRLLARPTAELSIEAQEKHERMEKLFAD